MVRGWFVWWDRTIQPGQVFADVIHVAWTKPNAFVVLWPRNSIRSGWVVDQALEGRDQGKLIPARLDDVSMPRRFRSRQAANLVGWRGKLRHAGFDELAHGVEAILKKEARRTRVAAVAAEETPHLFMPKHPPPKRDVGLA
jgi:hypothetical protein